MITNADSLSMHDRRIRWRMSLALTLWVGGFFLPLAIPLVIRLPLPVATRIALSGLLVLGLPQLLTVIAIALVGKSGVRYLEGTRRAGAALISWCCAAASAAEDTRSGEAPCAPPDASGSRAPGPPNRPPR
jgi:hypothetical protein